METVDLVGSYKFCPLNNNIVVLESDNSNAASAAFLLHLGCNIMQSQHHLDAKSFFFMNAFIYLFNN